jgi:hypothetical protein
MVEIVIEKEVTGIEMAEAKEEMSTHPRDLEDLETVAAGNLEVRALLVHLEADLLHLQEVGAAIVIGDEKKMATIVIVENQGEEEVGDQPYLHLQCRHQKGVHNLHGAVKVHRLQQLLGARVYIEAKGNGGMVFRRQCHLHLQEEIDTEGIPIAVEEMTRVYHQNPGLAREVRVLRLLLKNPATITIISPMGPRHLNKEEDEGAHHLR